MKLSAKWLAIVLAITVMISSVSFSAVALNGGGTGGGDVPVVIREEGTEKGKIEADLPAPLGRTGVIGYEIDLNTFVMTFTYLSKGGGLAVAHTIPDYADASDIPWRDDFTELVFSGDIWVIGSRAFANAPKVTTLTFDRNSLTTISDYAFDGVDTITTINYNGTRADWAKINIGTNNGVLSSSVEQMEAAGITFNDKCALNGHSFGEWTTEDPGTCVSKGTEKRICSVCGADETREAENYGPHAWSTSYSSDETYHWIACQHCVEISSKATHDFGEWYISKEATTTDPAEESRVCATCKYTETRTVEPQTLTGDLNGNGVLDADDAALLSKYILKLGTLTTEQLAIADMNGDAKFDINDVVTIILSAKASGTLNVKPSANVEEQTPSTEEDFGL